MRYKFIILFLLIGFVSKAQVYQIMPQYGYTTFRMNFDSTIQIPTFCGVPRLGSNVTKKGALAFDSCNNRFYYFNPKLQAWDTIKSADASLFVKYSDTAQMLSPYLRKGDTIFLSNRIDQRVKYTDTSAMLSPYFEAIDTVNLRRVTSVGLTMPSAFTVTNSPITTSGTIGVTGAGTASQYVRGDGVLGDFPTATTGGGASVSYYLNGSVNKGTFGGNTYYEMSRTAIIGAGTDFTRTNAQGDGYIAQFITDTITNLLIPVGNWNLEFYFNASSGGGSPSFYVELYKYDGTNFTLISSNSTSPELIAFGTTINPYFSALAVPETILSGTDRLALRIYVNTSGRSITLHTENSHLCQVITTFTTGLTAINGLTKQVQYLAVGTSGTDFNISSATDTHTFNLPTASATNRGALSSADWTTFNSKLGASDTISLSNRINTKLNISDTASMLAPYTRLNQLTNIYNSDGTLTGNRTVTMENNTLNFNGGRIGITASSPLSRLNIQDNNILAASNDTSGLYLSNLTAATNNNPKYSPSIVLDAQGWKTAATAGSISYKFRIVNQPAAFSTNGQSSFAIQQSTNNSAYSNLLVLSAQSPSAAFAGTISSGAITVSGGVTTTTSNSEINATGSNSSINAGGTSVASAVMSATSTTKGFLQPRLTTTQMNAISTPATGLSVFNTTDSLPYTYRGTGSGWQKNVSYTRTNDIGLLNGADQRVMIEPTTNVIAGRALTVEAGSTQAGGTSAFTGLNQTSRNYQGISAASNNDIYTVVDGGDIFKRTGGTGNFTALSQTSRQWFGIAAAPNGDIFASVRNGDIYKSTGGTGTFTALSAGNRNWRGMCAAPNGDIYAVEQGGDIYKSTNNGTTFTALGQTSRQWYGIAAAPNGDIFATDATANVYKQTGGTGNFVSLGFTSRVYTGITIAPNNDLYVLVLNGDIFKQTNSTGSLVSLGQTSRNWLQMSSANNGDIYATIGSGDIYVQSGGTANLNGGTLVLQSGAGKGTGTSTINFNTGTTLASGSTLQTASTKMTILGNGNVGIGTTSPSAILDVSSTTSAFLPPRMTTAQRDLITPVAGMVIYNTSTNKHQGHNGTTWNDFY